MVIFTRGRDVDPDTPRRNMVPDTAAVLRDSGFDDVLEIGRGSQSPSERAVAVKVLASDLNDAVDHALARATSGARWI